MLTKVAHITARLHPGFARLQASFSRQTCHSLLPGIQLASSLQLQPHACLSPMRQQLVPHLSQIHPLWLSVWTESLLPIAPSHSLFLLDSRTPSSQRGPESPSTGPSPPWGPSCSEEHSSALQCPIWSLSTLQGQRQPSHLGVSLGTWALQAKHLTPFPWMLRH